jgi:hypothetical protein
MLKRDKGRKDEKGNFKNIISNMVYFMEHHV